VCVCVSIQRLLDLAFTNGNIITSSNTEVKGKWVLVCLCTELGSAMFSCTERRASHCSQLPTISHESTCFRCLFLPLRLFHFVLLSIYFVPFYIFSFIYLVLPFFLFSLILFLSLFSLQCSHVSEGAVLYTKL
jgi:hypothetical protein